MADVIPRGRFVWHELITDQPDLAVGFYGKLAGWKVTAWENDPSYRVFDYQGAPRAGLMVPKAEMKGAPPHWLSYVAVPDVDATVKQAVSRGARAYAGPMDVPDVGRLAVLADPQDAVFAVFRPSTPGDPGDECPPADFSWHELATTDWRAAWDFYRGLFGWEKESEMDMGAELGTYFMFKRAGGTKALGGIYNKPKEIPAPNWLPYILVPSVDRAVAVAKANQGTVMNGPMDVPGGDRIAQLMDPVGAAIAVHSVAAQAAAKPAVKKAPEPKKTKAAKKAKPAKKATKKKPAAKKKASRKKTATKRPVKKRRVAKKSARRR